MKVSRKKVIIGAVVLVLGAALVFANLRFSRPEGVSVNAEAIERRDLEAVVSASGKIRPKRSVNISADTMGRVTDLAVNEGEQVRRGQFLLQIDPRTLRSAVQRGEAGLEAAESQVKQLRVSVETARVTLQQARDNVERQRELWKTGLTTKEALDRAENELKVREAELREREQQVSTQESRLRQERATLESARYDLSKVRIESPIDGIVTRRNIEEGETVVVGTMNNPGTVLMTIADMSVIEAEIEVDETDIPTVAIGQPATVRIDALPDREFTGRVTEVGNSPIQAPGAAAGGGVRQATNFKVVVTLEDELPQVRPGFTCTADVTTATRAQAVAVPIQATTIREVTFDAQGAVVRRPPEERRRRRQIEPSVSAEEPAGQTRREVEGAFVVREGRAVFVPVKTGIAGDRYFEVLDGLQPGDQVITGPFSSVREMADGDPVRVQAPAAPRRGR
jgi:HlyD family secretion protein